MINILAMERELTGIFKSGNYRSILMCELAWLTIHLMRGSGGPIYEAPGPGDIRHSLADISRLKACGF